MVIRLHGTVGSWTLPDGETVIGRGEGCDIRLADRRLSRRQALLTVRDGVVTIQEIGSANPVLVNGDRIQGRTALTHGDALVVGPFLVRVEIREGASPPRLSVTAATQIPGELPRPEVPARAVTQALDPDTLASLTSESRRAKAVDPTIAAALGRPPTRRLTDRHEADAWSVGEGSGALSTGSPVPPKAEPPRTHPTTAFTAPTSPAPPTSALTPGPRRRVWLRPLVGRRLAAAVLDGVSLVGIALTVALAPLALGVAVGAAAAGASLVDGRVVVGTGGALGWQALLPVVLLPGGLVQIPGLVTDLLGSPVAFPGLFMGLTASAILAEIVLLWGTIGATMRRGAPWWHRVLGLEVVVQRNGHRLGWGRATCRWVLALVLAPLALITVWFGGRSLHDRWCGAEVRAKQS